MWDEARAEIPKLVKALEVVMDPATPGPERQKTNQVSSPIIAHAFLSLSVMEIMSSK